MKYIVENKIIIDNNEYEYIIIYKNIKHIYFRVKSDMKIYVTASKLVSKGYIENLLYDNIDLLKKMINKQKDKMISSKDIFYLGNKLLFVYNDGKPYINNDYIYAKSVADAKEYIYSLASNIFLERVNQIKNNFNDLPEFKLKLRKMTSKWGVCNKRSMSITLNTYLIEKDVHLIDYVIIHELCHFKYMDHSDKFWNYVSKFYPYYKQARKELNY